MTLTLRYAARSDRGLIREGNQDSVFAGPRLLAVADGMGGMAAGDVASNIVIGVLAPLDEDVPGGDLIDVLRNAVANANQQLREAVDANPQMEGMGTTLTAILFGGTRIGLVHVGDSRAYLLRDSELIQITKDDTYVQMLVDEGRITAEEANSHPQRSLLTRALDGRDVDPEYSVREARAGDRYLLCSDGLSGVVSQETIAQTLREIKDPSQCVERLIQLALRGGGPDNVTVIVADVTDDADIVESQPVVGGAAAQDRGLATAADRSSPAGRAALAAPPRNSTPSPENYEDDEDDESPRRSKLRVLVVAVILIMLFAAGGWFGWHYTQSQYFVGVTEEGYVAVFRGVPGEIAGLNLSSVEEASTEITVDDLVAHERARVERGIPAENRAAAYATFREITANTPDNDYLLPLCWEDDNDAAVPPPQDVTPSPSTSIAPSPTPSTDAASPTPDPSASESLVSPSPEPTQLETTREPAEPGVNCRED